MDVLLGRTSYELVATVANYLCLVVIWMDSFSHFVHLFVIFLYRKFGFTDFSPINSFISISHLTQECKIFFRIISPLKMSTLNSTFFHIFIVLPFCTIRSLFYCIFSLLDNAIARLPLLPASHAPPLFPFLCKLLYLFLE